MRLYVIAYDLRTPRDYSTLYEALRAYPVQGQILEPVWLVGTDLYAAQIRAHLMRHLAPGDGLAVIRAWGEAAWLGVKCDTEWLKRQIQALPLIEPPGQP